MNEYIHAFKDKSRDKNNKLMYFHIDDDKLLEKYKTSWTKIQDLKNTESDALPVHDDRYTKTKIRTNGDKVYTNSCGSNVSENGVECESVTLVSIDSFLFYDNKYYLQVYLNNCGYKIVNKQKRDYLDENLFETDED